ncbi:Exocyst complex component sec5 isoform 1 [Hibiscus syriacus]|uniref:Exocyst complex component sec5 isoform 1 n=1 Tax=Hibiscus syriacus TaxID=106335 RepID=A0A6A3CVY0_HIBSY|nr:Exocyst complex component sec5 isoform 1 [Hibiscus syriacus]
MPQNLSSRRSALSQYVASNNFSAFTEDAKTRALVKSTREILFLCGNNKRAVIATLSVVSGGIEGSEGSSKDVFITQALEGLSIESASDLQKVLRVVTFTSSTSAFKRLEAMIPIFQSRMGALLFLISALLSRGLDRVQADRDDPSLPLVTAPFGHASQEIVNLLLCGQAVPNVFDGMMDLGGGMFLKGIPTRVEVGFLTLLESLNFCKVGQNLKCPKWPIWVVGSESHYKVLFARDTTVQDENELEKGNHRSGKPLMSRIRVEVVALSVWKLSIKYSGRQVILDLDKNLGGLKDSTGQMGRKIFDLYHFNGNAKSDLNSSRATVGGESPVQRPRLTKLRVSAPPSGPRRNSWQMYQFTNRVGKTLKWLSPNNLRSMHRWWTALELAGLVLFVIGLGTLLV